MPIGLTRNDVVRRAKNLKVSSAYPALFEAAFVWTQILCCLALYYLYPSWPLYILVVLFISARQYGLAILIHDGQHTLLHQNKAVNQWLGTWLLAAPIGTVFCESQKSHLDHHFHFGQSDLDPDYALYCFGDPSKKQTARQLTVSLGKILLGGKVIAMLKRRNDAQEKGREPTSLSATDPVNRRLASQVAGFASRFWRVALVQSVFVVLFMLAFGWYGYFALWALPLVTLAPFYNDFRIFCEHSLVGRDSTIPDERMVTFISSPLERFFFAPFHMNYHAEHHFFPYVPHRNLPALRDVIKECPEFNERIEWRSSYVGHLKAYTRAFQRAGEPVVPKSSGTIDGDVRGRPI